MYIYSRTLTSITINLFVNEDIFTSESTLLADFQHHIIYRSKRCWSQVLDEETYGKGERIWVKRYLGFKSKLVVQVRVKVSGLWTIQIVESDSLLSFDQHSTNYLNSYKLLVPSSFPFRWPAYWAFNLICLQALALPTLALHTSCGPWKVGQESTLLSDYAALRLQRFPQPALRVPWLACCIIRGTITD